jgi:pimeloyl-ACP methyl ester carboxylesterase
MANFEVRPDGTVAPWLTRERHMRVLRGLWEHDPLALFPRIPAPSMLIVAGSRDEGPPGATRWQWFTDAVSRLADGRLVELSDAHHDVHAQRPEAVAALLQELAEDAAPRAAG